MTKSSKVRSSVFASYLDRHICLKRLNDESTIAYVARLNAWIYVTVFCL